MSTTQDIKGDLAAVGAAVAAERAEIVSLVVPALTDLRAQVQALKDQLVAALPVTQADLDEIDASAKALVDSVGAIVTPADVADPSVIPVPAE